jgi:hypothetical protein
VLLTVLVALSLALNAAPPPRPTVAGGGGADLRAPVSAR